MAHVDSERDDFYNLTTFKKWFQDYESVKTEEINEKIKAFDYYEGHQWTKAEQEALNKRGQPPTIHNVILGKIRDLVGINIESRQEPKAFSRNDKDEEASDTVTSVLRFINDKQKVDNKSALAFKDFLVGGYECMKADVVRKVNLTKGTVDNEIRVNHVNEDTFFYDPTSRQHDFSDCDYLGEYKWVKRTKAKVMFGGDFMSEGSEDIDVSGASEEQQRQEKMWEDSSKNRVRVVEMWYKRKGDWWFVMFWGGGIKIDKVSPYLTEEGKPRHPYSAMSNEIDKDGDRWGEVRAMFSPQDGINHRKSKMQHQLSVRQTMFEKGAVDDVNKMKSELSKADGAVEINGDVNKSFQMIPQNDQITGQASLLQEDKDFIERVGANQALLGQAGASASGRAIRAQQNAGLVQLSSVFKKHGQMKENLARLQFELVKQFWTAEKVIRVTDDAQSAKYITLNGVGIGADGQPVPINSVAEMDVDIIIQESPSASTQQQEDFEDVISLAGTGLDENSPMFRLLVELSSVSEATKKKILEGDELTPEQQQAAQSEAQDQKQKTESFELLELQKLDAGNKKTIAETDKTEAETAEKSIKLGMLSQGVEV